MRLSLALFLVALAFAVLRLNDDVTAQVLSPSCMTHRLYKSGFSHSKAIPIERSMVAAEMTEEDISDTPTKILRIILRLDYEETRKIQDCIAKRSDRCKQYEPCRNGGVCQLNAPKNGYVCVCHADFTGKFCTTPHPAPRGELRALKKQFKKFKESTEEKLNVAQGRLKAAEAFKSVAEEKLRALEMGCNSRSLGYRYQSRRQEHVKTSGALASLTLRKKHTSTVLRVAYSTNIRLSSSVRIYGRWFVTIDGVECRKPGMIDIAMYNNNGDRDYIPSVLLGICEETNAGPIGKGDHTITVSIGRIGNNNIGAASSGWASTSILEVQEMCPQY